MYRTFVEMYVNHFSDMHQSFSNYWIFRRFENAVWWHRKSATMFKYIIYEIGRIQSPEMFAYNYARKVHPGPFRSLFEFAIVNISYAQNINWKSTCGAKNKCEYIKKKSRMFADSHGSSQICDYSNKYYIAHWWWWWNNFHHILKRVKTNIFPLNAWLMKRAISRRYLRCIKTGLHQNAIAYWNLHNERLNIRRFD